MKIFLAFVSFFYSVSSKGLLLPFGRDYGDLQSPFFWSRWSDDPGAWCYPIGFGNHTFTYFNRNYTRAKICYGSLVFTDTARILLARDSCQSPMLDYDALFPFHYVAEYGNVVAHHRIETGKIARREVDKLMRSIRGHSSRKFEAAWAFVVTWDIKAWEYDLEATVQAVLFCDEQTVIPFCYAIYSYGDQTKIQAFNGIEQRVGGVGWTRGPNDRCQDNDCELRSTSLSWEADLWLLCLLGFHSTHLETVASGNCNSTMGRASCSNIREHMKKAKLFNEIPSSKTPEIRYLPLKSNIDIPGMFLFSLSDQKPTPESKTVLPFLEIEPNTVYIYTESRDFSKNFSIYGFPCENHMTENFEVLFSGESYSVRMPAKCELLGGKSAITGLLPFWARTGDVNASLYKNSILASQPMQLDFPRYESGITDNAALEISSRDETTHWTTFTWNKQVFADTTQVIPNILYVKDRMEGLEDPYLVTRFVLLPIPNNGSHSMSISSRDFVFIQLIAAGSQSSCQNPTESKSLAPPCGEQFIMNQVPLTPTADLSCEHWLEEESKLTIVGGGDWFDGLKNYYPCPRRPEGGGTAVLGNETDAYFAREEVKHGMGWKYDPCCSNTPSLHVGTLKFCTRCECNEGANWCIISPPIKIQVQRNGSETKLIHETTNQCCYDQGGSLITDPNKGAGRASMEVNRPYNTFAHYKSDILPYLSCCEGWKSTPDTCNRFRKHRPVVVGKYYVPCYITMTVVERDPHFTTLDGFHYTFNGLGVYTMLRTVDESSKFVELQVSTRRKGNGTVLSGFAMKDNHSMVEGYLPINKGSQLEVRVNNKKFRNHMFREIRLSGVEIREVSSTEFVFTLVNSGLQIEAMITDSSILNIATIPPLSMVDDVMGLLGNFDGDPENDLYGKNTTLLSSKSTMREIHDNFGESWKVFENDWLFNLEFALKVEKDIRNGMPYEASYELNFESDDEEIAIKDACDADETCMLDVFLTKDFSFASTTNTIKQLRRNVETISSKYARSKQTVIQEVKKNKNSKTEMLRKEKNSKITAKKSEGTSGRTWYWMAVYMTMALTIARCIGR